MRSMLLVLLAPVLALAVSNSPTVDIVAPEEPVQTGEPVATQETRIEPAAAAVLVGTVDTVGGTTYDWCSNGPIYRFIANSPGNGVHVVWMYSTSTSGTEFPDRNMRYNYYDYSSGEWNWIDTDYMQSGVNVYSERCGYGNLAVDPNSGVAIVPAHLGTPLRIDVARDMAPGVGIFEVCSGSPTLEGYLWPPIDVDVNSKVHIHCMLDDDPDLRNDNYYSGMGTWCSYSDPTIVYPPQPKPEFPDQAVTASRVSDNVCLTWVYSPDGYSQKPGFYRISTDGGTSWGPSTQLPWPLAYQGDTLASFHITSLFPFYDSQDELHIVASVTPFVRDTNYILPADIWHWKDDAWTFVHKADPESLMAGIGYNASMACRPSIGEDNEGNLFVAWEEFDGVNVDTVTDFLRGDIWGARGNSAGTSWGEALRLTGPGEPVSHRFPSIIDKAVSGTHYTNDTVMILYEIDQQAGFFVQGEGTATNNAMVVQRVVGGTFPEPPGAVEEGSAVPTRIEVSALPNPLSGRTRISYALPRTTEVTLVVYDEAGRPVQTLHKGLTQAGRHTATWNTSEVPAGVYFYKLHAGDQTLSEKLVVSR